MKDDSNWKSKVKSNGKCRITATGEDTCKFYRHTGDAKFYDYLDRDNNTRVWSCISKTHRCHCGEGNTMDCDYYEKPK